MHFLGVPLEFLFGNNVRAMRGVDYQNRKDQPAVFEVSPSLSELFETL